MQVHEHFIPKDGESQPPDNDFRWTQGQGEDQIIGEFARFAKITLYGHPEWPADIGMGKKYWRINGANYNYLVDQPNYLGFIFLVPYLDEELMVETYEYEGTFGKGLDAAIVYTIDNGPILVNSAPDVAELTIKLDPRTGKLQGEFRVRYLDLHKHLDAAGTFNMTL